MRAAEKAALELLKELRARRKRRGRNDDQIENRFQLKRVRAECQAETKQEGCRVLI